MQRDRIESRYRQLLGAWNRRDAAAFAALFTPDGLAVAFDGSVMSGRAEIASTLASVFLNERTGTYAATVRGVSDIAPGVALLRAIVGMVPPDSFDLNLMINATQSVVYVESDGDIKVALLQSTPAAFHGRSEVAVALALELEEIARNRPPQH
jgi:uncharacterized protein (TIGR02246 family)